MEAKERLFHSRNIGIHISPYATKYDIQNAHTIACGLKQLGKNVEISLQKPRSPQKISTVILKGLASRIAQVTYETDAEDLKLHFVLQQGNMSLENISLEIEQSADLTIIVGDSKAEHNYEKIYSHVLELLLNHADPSFRCLGTILFKLELSPTHNMYTSTITQEDFQAALVYPKHAPQAIQALRNEFGEQCSYLLYFEKPGGGFQTILWTVNPQLQKSIHSLHADTGKIKGNWILWDTAPNEHPIFHAPPSF
jgi:hypothetical protein